MEPRDIDPIVTFVREGTDDSPYSNQDELLTVDSSGKIQLTEYPHRFTRLIVEGDDRDWYEVEDGDLDIDSYRVDYQHKIVTFDTAHIGKQLNIKYTGVGGSLISVKNIYTEADGLGIKETLDEVIEDSKGELTRLEELIDSAEKDEESRKISEENRKNQESERKANESERIDNEDKRLQEENVRVGSENIRKSNEDKRVANESERKSNEGIRESQEAKRQEDSANAILESQQATSNAIKSTDRANQAADRANEESENLDVLKSDVTDATENANASAQNADDKATLAQNKVNELSGLNDDIHKSISDAEGATESANTASERANTSANNADAQANYAKEQGDYAKSQGDIVADIIDGSVVASVNGQSGHVELSAEDVDAIPVSEKGVAQGVATLNEDGKVVDSDGNLVEGKVKSVNGQTGEVVIETFSGSYNDLSNKPSIPSKPEDVGAAPANHEHTESDITDLDKYTQAEIDDKIGVLNENINTFKNNIEGIRQQDDNFQYKINGEWVDLKGGSSIKVGNVSGLTIESLAGLIIEIAWSDPADIVVDDIPIAEWAGTQLRGKIGSYPIDEKDGELITDNTERDKYAGTPFKHEDLTEGDEWFYMLFPYTIDGAYTVDSSNRVKATAVYKFTQDPPSAPEVSDISHDSATVTGGDVVSLDKTDWFDSPHEFTGLTEETEYTAYAKFEETDVYFESEISSLTFSTKKKGIPLSELPVGTKVKLGKYQVESESPEDLVWQIAAKNHSGYPSNSVTLITKDIIDIRGFDAKEPSNSDSSRSKYGNNRYKESNIRQWLNKSGSSWFTKTHTDDEPPTDAGTNDYGTGYDDKKGFLSFFNDDERGAMLDTNLKVVKARVDGGGSETVTDKVFLPSTTEVGLTNESGTAEGSKYALFTNDSSRVANVSKQAETNSNYNESGAGLWWLRTPYASSSDKARLVNPVGSLRSYGAYYGKYGFRPALNLKSGVFVSDSPDSDGAYLTVF